MIYVLTDKENVEAVRKMFDKFHLDNEVKIVTSVDEVPNDVHVYKGMTEPIPYMAAPKFETPLLPDDGTEYQKLCSFNSKEKNKARQRLERKALKYQNKHYKK